MPTSLRKAKKNVSAVSHPQEPQPAELHRMWENVQGSDTLDKDSLIQDQKEDSDLLALMQKTQEEDSPYFMREGVLMFVPPTYPREQARIVVPEKWRSTVLRAGHDLAGHFGKKKTTQLIQAEFHWPGMSKDIVNHIKTCSKCLTWNSKKTQKAPLQPLPVISTPWEMVATDVVGPLPRTKKGNRYLLTIQDFATRYLEALPMKKADAATTCQKLKECFARFGYPKRLLSDNGGTLLQE